MSGRPRRRRGWLPDLPDLPGASCDGLDGDSWFPEAGRPVPAIVARICASCPVRRECAEYALSAGPSLRGVWGGLTEADRARIRAGRRGAA